MEEIVVTALVLAGTSVLLLVFAYLIRVRRAMSLIAGYDPERVADDAGLARWVGTQVGVMGAAGLLITVLILVAPDRAPSLMLGYVIGIVALSVRCVIGCRTYMKEPETRRRNES